MSTKTQVLAHHFADLKQQHQADTLGMWIFLATEVMFFGGLFLGYTVYRYLYEEAFAEASRRLNLAYGGWNTVVLLTSSLTMALAVYAAQIGKRRLLVGCLLLTALLGTAFLVVKGFEYHADYVDRLVPGLAFDNAEWTRPQESQLLLLLYYLMTGVHAVHLTIGIVIMLVLANLARTGRYGAHFYTPIEVGGLYWHFVDVIWIFLLPMLYMIGVRG